MDMPKIETTVVKLSESLYSIDQVMVRSFLIIGRSGALLLDTGAADEDLPALVSGLTDLPLTVCLSHSDGDHTASLGRFDRAYIHPKELELLKNREPNLKTGLIPVEDGHEFDLGGTKLRVIHNPGHTPGSISLLNEETGELFSGDTVSYGPVFMFGGNRDMDSFIHSLEKLSGMAAEGKFRIVYPCHNTCPIDAGCADELLACARGIADGTLEGTEPEGMLPPGAAPKLFMVGKSGIYYEP